VFLRASVPLCEVLLVFLILGCGSGDGAADVKGEVTLDGQPLTEGVIHFMPVDGKSRTASTFVRDGRFETRVPLGKQRVEISCVKTQPLRPGQMPDSATGAEIVPAKYNTKSELMLEVKRGKNEPRFELTSK
jgi:hypothetical protein